MRALYLLRHSLTEANDRRLYCGWSDPPLSAAGRALAKERARLAPLPDCACCATSDLRRAVETLALMTGRAPDIRMPELREMCFGRFELRAYEELKGDGDYLRWILDEAGDIACPGGESRNAFRARVLRGGDRLLGLARPDALAVLHGGVIACLMQAWFPAEGRDFYGWQPAHCRGWRVDIAADAPTAFAPI